MLSKIKHIRDCIQEELWDRKQHICISCKYTPFMKECNLTQCYPNGDKIYPEPLETCITGNYKPHSWIEVIKFIFKHYLKPIKKHKVKKENATITTDYDWD